jgi:hypothetical protein
MCNKSNATQDHKAEITLWANKSRYANLLNKAVILLPIESKLQRVKSKGGRAIQRKGLFKSSVFGKAKRT